MISFEFIKVRTKSFQGLHGPGLACLLLLFPFCGWAQQAVTLMKPEKPALGWTFGNGQEFPGAKGGLEADLAVQHGGQGSLKLVGDFTGGGNYVQAATDINGADIRELSFWIRNFNHDSLTIRLIDSSGRCHQFNLKAEPTAEWQKIVLPLEMFFEKQATAEAVTSVKKYEAWGGDKNGDGKWKGPARGLSILIGKTETEKVRTIWINGAAAIPPLPKGPPKAGVSSFQDDFESKQAIEKWTRAGDVVLDGAEAFKGKQSLVLQKNQDTLRDNVSATGPPFPVGPGKWEIQFAGKSELDSKDNSYNGSLEIEVTDGGGKAAAKIELASLFRKNGWRPQQVQIDLPEGSASARFVARINKETVGKFWIDELSARAGESRGTDDRVKRIMFSTARLGNLLYPDDPKEATVEVWSSEPLTESQKAMSCVVKDYWSAEQGEAVSVLLKEAGKKDNLIRYEGKADFSAVHWEVGRFYEIHGNIERAGGEPFSNYSSFAILPEAAANRFKPEEISFTSRNWDNRLEAYVRLTHRLGIRVCGVWGKMESDPAKVEAPQIELIRELGMGFLTGSPAHAVEHRDKGWEELMADDGRKMREGVRNFIAKYGQVRPMIVNLGNEPHTKGDEVKVDVEAYRIVYDEIKKVDPGIYVVGTSVGLDEENYFKFGFGKWCDAYDVHTYESPESVKHNLTVRYPEMFRKYGEVKPIWSTEIGLNSQGLTRQAVASTLTKKFAYFFASGGANVSWFGLLYPDADGSGAASSGSAHNVFDCRYNRYSPKLDAVAYYNAVNAIANKKFVQEKTYGKDAHVFLFQDSEKRSLLICFKDQGREDVFFPLKGVGEVKAIRVDGTIRTFNAGGTGVTLTLNEDPLLLLCEGAAPALPEKLGTPLVQLGEASGKIHHGKPNSFDVFLNGTDAGRLTLRAPAKWSVEKTAARNSEGKDVARFSVEPPAGTTAREADMTVTIDNIEGNPSGALFYRPEMAGLLSPSLSAGTGEKGPLVKLMIRNHSAKKQELTWDLVLKGEQSPGGGKMAAPAVYFSEPPSGALLIEGNQSAEVAVPLLGADSQKNYQVQAVIRDASGRITEEESSLRFSPAPGGK